MKLEKRLLVVDFDNTLFDWVALWHSCFSAMMNQVVEISGVPFEEMREQIRTVHREHRTSEYAFLLESLPALQPCLQGRKAVEVFSDAIKAFRNARSANLNLYPSVAETLLRIKGSGTRIAVYTESLSYYSFYRLKRLGLDGVVDAIYTPPDHDTPDGIDIDSVRSYSNDFYRLRFSKHEHTPLGELKPNPHILGQIIEHFGVTKEEAVYVGDSRHKDIAMARDAGVDHAWAKYGEAQDSKAYELLKSVTHWTDEDVVKEHEIRSREVSADVVLEDAFSDILDYYEFLEFSS